MSDNLPALIDYSKALAGSDLLPAEYRGKPANVLVAIEYGKALGLEPMSAIQGITVIKGKPTASASLMAGLVRRAGHTLRVTGDDKRAECTIIRSDDPEFEFKAVWTIDRAKKAGLVKAGPWMTYPEAMLKARAISECARNACSEILAGVQYTPEELGEDADDAPVSLTARRSAPVRAKGTTSTVPKAERPTVAEPDFDDVKPAIIYSETGDEADVVVVTAQRTLEVIDAEIVEDEPAPVGDPITEGQLKALHAALNAMGIKDRDTGLTMLGRMVGRQIASTKELTKAEAHKLIDSLHDDDKDNA